MKSPIYKTLTQALTGETDYDIKVSGETIHSGRAKSYININNQCETFLNCDLNNIDTVENEVVSNSDAYKEFTVQTPNGSDVYGLLYDWSYDSDWTGQTKHNMSDPVNGHLDARMKMMSSIFDTAQTEIEWVIEYQPVLVCEPKHLERFPLSGGSQTINITSNGGWSVSAPEWVTVSPSAGSGSRLIVTTSAVSFTVGNNLEDDRYGDIYIIGDGVTAHTEVYQIGTPETISISSSGSTVGSASTTITINITATRPWTVNNPLSWVSVSPTTGRTTNVTLNVETNEGDARNGVITFSTPHCAVTYTIAQSERPEVISISPSSVAVGYQPTSITATVSATRPWTVNNSLDWVTVSPVSGSANNTTVTFNISENSGLARSGSITFNTPHSSATYSISQESQVIYNKIFYTSTDGNVVTPNLTYFPVTIVSNTYDAITGGCITFGENISYIGMYSFSGKPLRTISFQSGLTTICEDAFGGCTGLTQVILPDGLTNIESYAFNGCELLTEITIPNSVTIIEDGSFVNCNSLTGITIGNCVTSIGRNILGRCASLRSIIVSNNNTTFDSRNNCNAIINTSSNTLISGCRTTIIPSSVTSIGQYAFNDCVTLSSISIPNSVTSIGYEAFNYCVILSGITIPDSVASIGDDAYYQCHQMTSVSIGSGVTNIGKSAFYHCSALTSITCKANTPPELGNWAFDDTNNCPIYVPSGSVSTYKSAWSAYADRIQAIPSQPSNEIYYTTTDGNVLNPTYSGIEVFGANITSNTYTDKGVIAFDGNVTIVGQNAFNGCITLASVLLPDTVATIGNSAFYYCSAMTSVSLGSGVTSIGDGAFIFCYSFTGITIPDGVTSIGNGAFQNCEAMTNVYLSSGITSINNNVFGNCHLLTGITIPNSVTSIGAGAFSNCTFLTGITIPSGVTSIGNRAFNGCNFTSITIPDSVISIGESAFYYCNKLTDVTIGNSVTSIGQYAFQYCHSLTGITIPDSMTYIGYQAFYSCRSLREIICISITPPELGYSVFNNTNNCPIYVPSASVNTYKTATNWSNYSSRIQAIPTS